MVSDARFEFRATAVSHLIDRIKFEFSATLEIKSYHCRVARKTVSCYTTVAPLGSKRPASFELNLYIINTFCFRFFSYNRW